MECKLNYDDANNRLKLHNGNSVCTSLRFTLPIAAASHPSATQRSSINFRRGSRTCFSFINRCGRQTAGFEKCIRYSLRSASFFNNVESCVSSSGLKCTKHIGQNFRIRVTDCYIINSRSGFGYRCLNCLAKLQRHGSFCAHRCTAHQEPRRCQSSQRQTQASLNLE